MIRDADMEIQEDEASDLLETIEQGLRQRQFGPVVRLAVDEEMPESMVQPADGEPGGGAGRRLPAAARRSA